MSKSEGLFGSPLRAPVRSSVTKLRCHRYKILPLERSVGYSAGCIGRLTAYRVVHKLAGSRVTARHSSNMLDRYFADKHLIDRHFTDRYLINGYLVDRHLIDRRLM